MNYHQLVRLVLVIFAITTSVRALPSSNAIEEQTGSTQQNTKTTNGLSGDTYTIQSPSRTSNLAQVGTSGRSSSNKIDSYSETTGATGNSVDKSTAGSGNANNQRAEASSESESSPTTSAQFAVSTTSQVSSEGSKSTSATPEHIISSSQQKTEITSPSVPSSTSSLGTSSSSSASDRAVGPSNSGGSSNTYEKKTSSQTIFTTSSDTETRSSSTPTTFQSSADRSEFSSERGSDVSAGLLSDPSVTASSPTSSTSDQRTVQTSISQDVNTISPSTGAPTSSPATSSTAHSETTSALYSEPSPKLASVTGESLSVSTNTPLASSISNTQSSQHDIADDTDATEGTSSETTTSSDTSSALSTQNVLTIISDSDEPMSTLTTNDTPLTSSSQSSRPTSSITDELTLLTSTPALTASSDSIASDFSLDNPFGNELFVSPSTTSDTTQSTPSRSDSPVSSKSSSSATSVLSTSLSSADQATTSTGNQLTSSPNPTYTVSTDATLSSSELETNSRSGEELISTSFEELSTSSGSDFSQTPSLSSSGATDGVTISTDSGYQSTSDLSTLTPTLTVPVDTTISSSEPIINSGSSEESRHTFFDELASSSSTGEQPSSSTGEQPSSSTGEQPSSSTVEQPSSSAGEQPSSYSIDTSITSSPLDSAGEGERTVSKSSSDSYLDQTTSTPITTAVTDSSDLSTPLPNPSPEYSFGASETSSSTSEEPDTTSTMPASSYSEETTSNTLTSDTSESPASGWSPSPSTTATPPLTDSLSTSDNFEQSTPDYPGPSSTTSTQEVPIFTATSSSDPIYTISTTAPSSSSTLIPIRTDATRDSTSLLQTTSGNTITNPIYSLSSFVQSTEENTDSAPYYTDQLDTSSRKTTGSISDVTLVTSSISDITSQDSPTYESSYITIISSGSSTSTSGNVGGEIATSMSSADKSNIDIGQSSYETPSPSSLTATSQFHVSQDSTSPAMETGSALNGQTESTRAQSFSSDITTATYLADSSYHTIATEEPTSSDNLDTIDSSPSETATVTHASNPLSTSMASQQTSDSNESQTSIGVQSTSTPFDTATSTFITGSFSDSMTSEELTISDNPQETHINSHTETTAPSPASSGTFTVETQPNDTGSDSLRPGSSTRSSDDYISESDPDGSSGMPFTTRPAQSTGALLTTGQTAAATSGARSSSGGGRTTFWLPSSIQVQSEPTRSGTSFFDPAVTATLPQLIAPPTAVPAPENASKITVGFKKNLNYEFLVSSSMTAAQIFHFLPSVLSFPFDEDATDKEYLYKRRGSPMVWSFQFNNTTTLMPNQLQQEIVTEISKRSDSAFPFNASAVEVIQIMPMIVKDRNYLTSIAVLYFPSAYVSQLQSMVSDNSSELFNNPDPTLAALAALIDPSIPLTGLIDGSTGSFNGGNPSTLSHSPSSPYKSQSSGGNSGSLESATSSGMSSAVKKRLVIYLTCFVFGTLLWILVFLFLYKHLYGGRVIANKAYQKDAAQEEKQHYSFADITSIHSADTELANDKSDDVPQEKDVGSAQSRFSLPEDLMITGENTVYSVSQGLQYFVAEDGSFYYAGPLQSTSEENETTKGDTADIEDINDYLYSAEQERSIVTNEQSSCDIGSSQIDEEGNFVVSDPSLDEEEHGFTSSNSATIEIYNNNNLYKMTRTVNSNEISSPRYHDQGSQGEMSDAGMGQSGNHNSSSSNEQNWHISSPNESEHYRGNSVFGFHGSEDSNNIVQSLSADNCIDEYLYVSGDDNSLLDSSLGVRIEEIDDDADDVHVDDLDELEEEMYKRRSKLMTQQQRTENGMLQMSRVMTAKAQGTRRM